jgi:Tfp pilus assembly protein PilW
MSRMRDQSGLTVIELAVAAAISLVVLGTAMTMMITMWRGGTLTERHATS